MRSKFVINDGVVRNEQFHYVVESQILRAYKKRLDEIMYSMSASVFERFPLQPHSAIALRIQPMFGIIAKPDEMRVQTVYGEVPFISTLDIYDKDEWYISVIEVRKTHCIVFMLPIKLMKGYKGFEFLIREEERLNELVRGEELGKKVGII